MVKIAVDENRVPYINQQTVTWDEAMEFLREYRSDMSECEMEEVAYGLTTELWTLPYSWQCVRAWEMR